MVYLEYPSYLTVIEHLNTGFPAIICSHFPEHNSEHFWSIWKKDDIFVAFNYHGKYGRVQYEITSREIRQSLMYHVDKEKYVNKVDQVYPQVWLFF